MISARLRHGSAWSDARIINVSTRGLCVRADQAPERGTYVEICKGSQRIIARVVWSRDESFGVQTQDLLAVDTMTTGIEPPAMSAATRTTERRLRPRQPTAAERHERSRRRSRIIEFVCVVTFGAAAATIAFDAVKGALLRPLATVSAQLGGEG